MAQTPKQTARNPAKTRQNEQKIDKSGKPGDAALSDDDLKKVTGGPIYMTGSHGAGGGGGAG